MAFIKFGLALAFEVIELPYFRVFILLICPFFYQKPTKTLLSVL